MTGGPSQIVYHIYTDGACKRNPGPGGWAALIRTPNGERIIRGADSLTTNNRMEMIAVIEATNLLENGSKVVVYSDSKYVIDGITKWLPKWKSNHWRTSADKPVKNSDLWRRLDEANVRLRIDWEWVKAHSGHPDNELVDSEAQQEAMRIQSTMNGDE